MPEAHPSPEASEPNGEWKYHPLNAAGSSLHRDPSTFGNKLGSMVLNDRTRLDSLYVTYSYKIRTLQLIRSIRSLPTDVINLEMA